MKLAFYILFAALAYCQFVSKVIVTVYAVDISKLPKTSVFQETYKLDNGPPEVGSGIQTYVFAEWSQITQYGYSLYRWFTLKLQSGGKLSRVEIDTASGSSCTLTAGFPFYIGEKAYYFGHGYDSSYRPMYEIRALLPEGHVSKMPTDSGRWQRYYGALFPFHIEGRVFIYGQAEQDNRWFIDELLPGGKLGPEETASGTWSKYYGVVFPFYIGGRVFMFGHTSSGNRWFIRKINSGGILGSNETDNGTWSKYYASVYSFQTNGAVYIYAQTGEDNSWFTSRLGYGGTLDSNQLDRGTWSRLYSPQVPFYI